MFKSLFCVFYKGPLITSLETRKNFIVVPERERKWWIEKRLQSSALQAQWALDCVIQFAHFDCRFPIPALPHLFLFIRFSLIQNEFSHFFRYNSKLVLLALPSVIFEPRFRGTIRNLVYADQPGVTPRRQEMRQPRDIKVSNGHEEGHRITIIRTTVILSKQR